MRKTGETRSSTVSTRLRPTVSRMQKAAAAPVVGDEAEALGAGAADRGQARGRAVDLDHARPFAVARRAIERGEQFGAPRAHDAGEADDLARAHDEAHVLRRLPAGPLGPGRESLRARARRTGLPNVVARLG